MQGAELAATSIAPRLSSFAEVPVPVEPQLFARKLSHAHSSHELHGSIFATCRPSPIGSNVAQRTPKRCFPTIAEQ